jgi:tetratricopeptide (TPR) repeat protein
MSQLYFDSALQLCPGFAEAWREKGVPYLKRGDFLSWRRYIDQAVLLKPRDFLGIRGWCRFKFLKDYEGALEDLKRYDTITQFNPGQSGDGSYHLYIVMALCERELGHYDNALSWFAKGIDSILLHKGAAWIGLYDHLHRAVTKISIKDYAGALADLDKQIARYEKYPEPWYYKAIVFIKTKRFREAVTALEKARLLYSYRITDPYCEVMDAVYLSDIEEALVICK